MALSALGHKLSTALSKLQRGSVDDTAVKSTINEIATALMQSDVSVSLVKRLRDNVLTRVTMDDDGDGAALSKARIVERAVVDELVRMLSPDKPPYKLVKGKPNVVMFVGLQGAGKTTTVAKYAHYYQQRKWRVAMVCADTFRAGAFDQLKQNATRIRVPFYGSYDEVDPVKIAGEGVAQFRKDKFDLIIVDTSGRHKQEAALFEEMQSVAAAVRPDDIIFVMDSTIGQAAYGQAEAFSAAVPVGSVIMTKLDGHAKGGGALSAVAATGSPIVFLGQGEHFDDLQAFDPHAFVGKLLGRGDIRGLMEEMKEKGIFDEAGEMMKGLGEKGRKFTYGDLRDQFLTLLKMGPVSKIMEALPGNIGQMMASQMPPGSDQTLGFKRMLYAIDSMTPRERELKDPIDQSRAMRIARGSGVSLMEVQRLMQVHASFGKVVDGLAKTGLLKGSDANFMSKMQRNPQGVMQQLQRSLDPAVLRRMGGSGGVAELLKSFAGAGGGGGGGLGGLLKGLGGGPGGPLGALGGGGMEGMAKMMESMMGGGGGEGGMPDMAALMGAMGGGGGRKGQRR